MTGALLQELGEAMTREMAKGGPVEAIKVCTELAPEIANRLSRENGWRVTRVGTRVRNPLLGMPDVLDQNVLEEIAARTAKGGSSCWYKSRGGSDRAWRAILSVYESYFRSAEVPALSWAGGDDFGIDQAYFEAAVPHLMPPSGTKPEICVERSASSSHLASKTAKSNGLHPLEAAS